MKIQKKKKLFLLAHETQCVGEFFNGFHFNLYFTIFHPQTCFVVNRRDRHHSPRHAVAALVKDEGAPERERMIMSIADDAASP
jgi:hypothetical protein